MSQRAVWISMRRGYLLLIPVLVGVVSFVWIRHAQPGAFCKSVDASTLSKVSTFLSSRMHMPPGTAARVTASGFLSGTCMQRLVVYQGNESKRSIYFLSDDHRYLFQQASDLSHPSPPRGTEPSAAPVDMTALTAGDRPTLGKNTAPVTIVEFSDFQCPYCKKLAQTLRNDVLPQQEGQVRLIFREFPLAIHPNAQSEAELAACTARQSNTAFWALHDYLFSEQKQLRGNDLIKDGLEYASKQPGINIKTLTSCVETHQTAQLVAQDIHLGEQYGVSSTPSLFLNGKRVIGAQDPAVYLGLIKSSLQPSAVPATSQPTLHASLTPQLGRAQ